MTNAPHILYTSPRLRGAMTEAQADALATIVHSARVYDLDACRRARAATITLAMPGQRIRILRAANDDCAPVDFPGPDDEPPPAAPAAVPPMGPDLLDARAA